MAIRKETAGATRSTFLSAPVLPSTKNGSKWGGNVLSHRTVHPYTRSRMLLEGNSSVEECVQKTAIHLNDVKPALLTIRRRRKEQNIIEAIPCGVTARFWTSQPFCQCNTQAKTQHLVNKGPAALTRIDKYRQGRLDWYKCATCSNRAERLEPDCISTAFESDRIDIEPA